MKRTLAAAAVLLLAGCAAVEPESPNPAACADLGTVLAAVPDRMNNADNINTTWSDIRADIDTIGLTSDGDVADRIRTLTGNWPDAVDIVLHNDYTDLNRMISDIERACTSDGATVTLGQFG